ncbi:hypothetical protein T8K17_23890 [Thalassobaculum sp. OXR-137]|uniref:hypothetical protein n=1 Tax=Thalassobaculum sp. OXR-137 TaxID=3100173 RepID=UPI002AC9A243|nr:hypothetical protein [Thalassobaculum sp. OXR-137]WPZ34260.1 hypothetical protein T8K17_23890 [Thalassobaculum sp. OXR-137]
MFGMGKKDGGAEKEEAERKRIEATMVSIDSGFDHLRHHAEAGNTERSEAAAKRLVESLKNPKLPPPYTKDRRNAVDAFLLHAYMKATALACKRAIDAGMIDDIEKRSENIKKAREFLAGAVKYKAPPDFKRQCERMLEVATFSGGVKAKGPTKAKPLDTAPKVKDRAKHYDPNEETEEKPVIPQNLKI